MSGTWGAQWRGVGGTSVVSGERLRSRLHLYGFDGEGVSLDGGLNGDVVSGVGDEGFWIADFVDLVADDEDGGRASLDALGGTVSGVGLAFGGTHGGRDEA